MNLLRIAFVLILVGSLLAMSTAGSSDLATWEYKVVILQGVTAGGTIEKESNGVYLDTRRTESLNDLAADGWQVVAVLGALGTDHTVYLKRSVR